MSCKVCDRRFGIRWDDLLEGAETGCSQCSFLSDCIRVAPFTTENIHYINFQRGSYCSVWLKDKSSVKLDIFTTHGNSFSAIPNQSSLHDVSVGHEHNPLQITEVRSHLPGSTSSATTFATIQRWIEECDYAHEKCNGTHESRQHNSGDPKRILDISNNKVILREGIRQQRYACLSHCWGRNTQFIKTLNENIESHKNGIQWDELSATFQEAIVICRRLNISYLWIDTFCIIQDNKADWEEQASQMADIYANAYLTIAATKAGDGSKGCFAEASTEYLSKLIPGYQDTYVRHQLPVLPLLWNHGQLKDNTWPLLNRGWIYQEMRLSSRVLHFCAQEVIWQCQTVQTSESGENNQDLESHRRSSSFSFAPYQALEGNPKYLWYRTVHEYSRLELTYESDKLAALAGLVQRIETLRPGDRYLVGLWEKTLLHDLLWYVTGHPTTERTRNPSFPSWTWASLNCQVNWANGLDNFIRTVAIQDIRMHETGPGHMGECPEASITLRGPVLDASPLLARYHSSRTEKRPRYARKSFGDTLNNPTKETITNLDRIYIAQYTPDIKAQDEEIDGTPSYIILLSAENRFKLTFGAIHVQRISGTECYKRVGQADLAYPGAVPGPDGDRHRQKASLVRRLIEEIPTMSITLV